MILTFHELMDMQLCLNAATWNHSHDCCVGNHGIGGCCRCFLILRQCILQQVCKAFAFVNLAEPFNDFLQVIIAVGYGKESFGSSADRAVEFGGTDLQVANGTTWGPRAEHNLKD